MRLAALVSCVALAGLASGAFAGRVQGPETAPVTVLSPAKADPRVGGPEVLPYTSGGFEGFAIGGLAGQNNFAVDVNPSNYQVQAAAGVSASKGVRVNGGVGNSTVGYSDWAYPTTTSFTPGALDRIHINIDIARTMGATTATSSFGYFIDVYNAATVRTFRFGLGTNSANLPVILVTSRFDALTGQFSPTAPISNVTVSAALTANTFYNLEARANYAAKTFDLYSNNTLFLANIPFADQTANNFSDADLHVSSNVGRTDAGFFDNYSVNAVTIPEPTSMSALAALGLVAKRRRR